LKEKGARSERVTPEAQTLGRWLEDLYARYNHRRYVHPDPLEFLYRYDDVRDREVAGLIASCLAYGRVRQILKSVERALSRIGGPRRFLERSSPQQIGRTFRGFKHRFTTGGELAAVLVGAKRAVERFDSLNACFVAGLSPADETVLPALELFVECIARGSGRRREVTSLLASPRGGSACKRLHLYLRWMVRRDGVDPGGWSGVRRSLLVIPLDTHMHRISLALGLTSRRQADGKTALEITQAFRALSPEDPVKYDFALTRLGIRDDPEAVSRLEEIVGGSKTAPGDAPVQARGPVPA
jgi:uncharacterized protein (TIGR02757 family)